MPVRKSAGAATSRRPAAKKPATTRSTDQKGAAKPRAAKTAAKSQPKPQSKQPTKKSAPAKKAPAPIPRTGFWLVKSEPEAFSWDDLLASPARTTCWDGVRNFLARNLMRDGMRVGDRVLFYHSSAEPTAVMGICEVVREAYPDHTQFDAADSHFDPKSLTDAPTWIMVDLRAVESLPRPLTLTELRAEPALAGMELLRRGSRLSVQPVTAAEYAAVRRLAGLP